MLVLLAPQVQLYFSLFTIDVNLIHLLRIRIIDLNREARLDDNHLDFFVVCLPLSIHTKKNNKRIVGGTKKKKKRYYSLKKGEYIPFFKDSKKFSISHKTRFLLK